VVEDVVKVVHYPPLYFIHNIQCSGQFSLSDANWRGFLVYRINVLIPRYAYYVDMS
jgi:hypothetical protein